jgi:tetratricopeptide (TPR) repeat protein
MFEKVFAILLIILIVLISICIYFVIHASRRSEMYLYNFIEEQKTLSIMIQNHVDESNQQFSNMQNDRRLDALLQNHDEAESQRHNRIITRLAIGENVKADEGKLIIDMLIDHAKNNFIEKGLSYYAVQAYPQAYESFSRALSYDENNTTLLFYAVYCLYLTAMNGTADKESYQMIFDGINIISEYGYKENELLDFSEAQMRKLVADMSTNMSGWQKEYVSVEKDKRY